MRHNATRLPSAILQETNYTMASRQIRDEIMRMTIAVNSDPAQKAIHELRKENVKFMEAIEDLEAKKVKLGRRTKENAVEFDNLTKEIKANQAAITSNKDKMEDLRRALDVNQMTMAQLRKEASLLKTQLSEMVPGSNLEQQRQLEQRLGQVNTRLQEVDMGARRTSSSFSILAERFNHYQGIAMAATAVLAGFALSVQSIIDRNNKMADAMSAVEKTTGMTRKEVEELSRSFKDLDTRTNKLDLMKIAESGGRLGIAKADIQDFVKEVDKANVALGDSWQGGADQIAETLGKVTSLYKQTKDLKIADSINEVGSALNELAANGAASEQNIADFTKRVGALPEKLKPPIHAVLGIGAALEESGIDSERGGTAFANFLTNAAKETKKFAEVMRIPEQKVKDLINTNPAEFFLKFSEGLKGLDATELANVLDHLKLNDQYIKSVVGAASDKTERFRQQIDLANKSMKDATSLTNEFNKVNNNTAAIFEKVKKKFFEVFTSPVIAQFLNDAISTFGKFIGAIEDSEGTVTDFRDTVMMMVKIIAIAAVSTISYNAAILLTQTTLAGAKAQLMSYTIVQKLNTALNQLSIVFQTAWNLAIGLGGIALGRLTGITVLQTAAQQRLNLAMAANPLGAVLALVTLLIGAYVAFGRETDKLAAKQRVLNDVKTEAIKKTSDEKEEIKKLVEVAKSESASNEDRAKALKKLNDIIPDHIGLLTEQNIKTQEGVSIINKYIDALDRRAYAEAINEKKKELLRKQIDIQGQKVDKGWGDLGGVGSWMEKTLNKGNLKTEMSVDEAKRLDYMTKTVDVEKELSKYIPLVQKAYRDRRNELKENFEEIKAIATEQKKLIASNPSSMLDDDTKSNYKSDGFDDDKNKEKEDKKREREAKRKQREAERLQREREAYNRMISEWMARGEAAALKAEEIQNSIDDARISAMKDGFEKEIAEIDLQQKRKILEIEKQKIGESDFKKLDEAIAKAKGDDKKMFEALRESWKKNNDELDNLKLGQIRLFQLKKEALAEKYHQEGLKQEEQRFQDELSQLERQKNEKLIEFRTVQEQKVFLREFLSKRELDQIYTIEDGKAAIEKEYQKRNLEMQSEFLRKKIAEFYAFMALNPLAKLDEEQLKNLKKYEEELAKLLVTKDKLQGKQGPDADTGLKSLAGKGKQDIFGLSADEWAGMFKKTDDLAANLGKVSVAIGIMQNMMSTYFAYVEANEKRQLQQYEASSNRKKLALKKQLLDGTINQEAYKKLMIKNDQDLEKRKAELALKQAKRERAMAVASAISNTALAIMGIWAQFPKADYGIMAGIMTGVVAALGAVQVATILSQPLPTAEGFEDGFYPIQREQDGKRFNARRRKLRSGLVDRPTHFLAGENGVEMVVDNPTWRTYSPQLKSAIHSANARANGFETGFNKLPENSQTTSSGSDEMMIKMMSLIGKNIEVLEEIKETGITAIITKNARNGKEIDEMRQEYLDLKNKNKH